MPETFAKPALTLGDENIIRSLAGIQRGVEKEGLRVTADNSISQLHHPDAVGSTLTHPTITTDYSEALLEFITPKQPGIESTIEFLRDLHSFTLNHLSDEVIWPGSMPCALNGDSSIPIADYGSSNIGQLKHVYRQGLGVRYGRTMQAIAGIHYNISLPDEFWHAYQEHFDKSMSLQDFKSAVYFSQIRNFRRYAWILHYLFGASPVLDKSFFNGQDHSLEQFSGNTFGLRYGTSLRMSDLGYQNSAQEDLNISYNSLDDYTSTLAHAVKQPYAKYEKIGMKSGEQYIQLNANILQLENEYYSDIRPKRVTQSGEKPIQALNKRGVEYIEVRILDINPFLAEGIDAEQIRFLDAFMVHCLIAPCPSQSTTSCEDINSNQHKIIMQGRDPELQLFHNDREAPFKEVGHELLDCVEKAATMLDSAHSTDAYTKAVQAQRKKIDDSSLTPSGQIMDQVLNGEEFLDICRDQAGKHKKYFTAVDLGTELNEKMRALAEQSLADQLELENSDTQSFTDYLDAYNKS